MKVELNQIKVVAKQSHTAQIIITALAMRERLSHTTNLNRFRTSLKANGERIDDKEFDLFWTNLDKCGVGRLVKNKNKMLDKFEWFYSLKDVCKFAIDEIKTIKRINQGGSLQPKPTEIKQMVVPQDFVEQNKDKLLFVALEDGSLCRVELTGKVTEKDTLMIVKAIKGVSL